MSTILVSGASGIVGYGILRSLKAAKEHYNLIGTSIYNDSVAPAFCENFVQAPMTTDPSYVDWLLAIVSKYKVDMVIPGIEIDMYKWVKHIKEIEQAGAIPLLNRVNLIQSCKDKWLFYEQLCKAKLSCRIKSSVSQDFDVLVNSLSLPFLLKPKQGFGAKGIEKIDNESSFLIYRDEIGRSLLAQQIVGSDDEEYTTSAFCDGRGGYTGVLTLRRKLSKDGYTEKAEVTSSDQFVKTISELCHLFKPMGPTNFQFRVSNDEIKLLEINPRISSSTSIRTAFGYNESEMAVNYFLKNEEQSQPIIKMGRAVRYTDEYIFYDDNSIHL